MALEQAAGSRRPPRTRPARDMMDYCVHIAVLYYYLLIYSVKYYHLPSCMNMYYYLYVHIVLCIYMWHYALSRTIVYHYVFMHHWVQFISLCIIMYEIVCILHIIVYYYVTLCVIMCNYESQGVINCTFIYCF